MTIKTKQVMDIAFGGKDIEAPTGFTKKIFAKPFRLVFLRHNKDENSDGGSVVTWIEVKSLTGLERVTQEIATGELSPINAWATLDRQLWGLLAEYTGFLRYEGPTSEGNAGIQPMGCEQAQLHDDMSELFGGFEPAIAAISQMRNEIVKELADKLPSTETNNLEFLKRDGINLTHKGETVIAKAVYGDQSERSLKLQMETANAESLTLDTDTDGSDVGNAIAEFDASKKDLQTFSGKEAFKQGRLVERAAEGNLDGEEDD